MTMGEMLQGLGEKVGRVGRGGLPLLIELLDGAVEIIFPGDEEGCFDQGTSDQQVLAMQWRGG